MTIQEAYEKITSSEELKKKAVEALKTGKGDEFLKEQGIDLTMGQIKEYLENRKSGELSREELDLAAGGGCGFGTCKTVMISVFTVVAGCMVSSVQEKLGECFMK